ncbi:hypothetical protein Bca4012_012499 [Brassica carinata]
MTLNIFVITFQQEIRAVVSAATDLLDFLEIRGREVANVLESAWQMWHVNGMRCPKGTVPIRRNNVLRAKSLFDFGKKRRSIDLDRWTEKSDALGTSDTRYTRP